jgi:hypothetical protein
MELLIYNKPSFAMGGLININCIIDKYPEKEDTKELYATLSIVNSFDYSDYVKIFKNLLDEHITYCKGWGEQEGACGFELGPYYPEEFQTKEFNYDTELLIWYYFGEEEHVVSQQLFFSIFYLKAQYVLKILRQLKLQFGEKMIGFDSYPSFIRWHEYMEIGIAKLKSMMESVGGMYPNITLTEIDVEQAPIGDRKDRYRKKFPGLTLR